MTKSEKSKHSVKDLKVEIKGIKKQISKDNDLYMKVRKLEEKYK
jgi:hypothetical protein